MDRKQHENKVFALPRLTKMTNDERAMLLSRETELLPPAGAAGTHTRLEVGRH